MSKIAVLLDQLEANIQYADVVNTGVSQASVGWQIDHTLKVINSVCNALKSSNSHEYNPTFNIKRSYFLLVKKIPRGRIKAPKTVRSYEVITTDAIEVQLKTARALLNGLDAMDKKSYFTHPFLGQFNLRQTLIFLELHTKHHLKIIDDILKK